MDLLIGDEIDVTVPLFNVEGAVICTGEDVEYQDETGPSNADYYTLDLPTRTYTISYHSNL